MRRLLKFLGWIILSVVLLIITAIILAFVYEKEIKGYAIEELNKYLNTPIFIDPENINLTFVKSFPNAALEFSNVKALEMPEAKNKGTGKKKGIETQGLLVRDTLFSVKYIGLQFNIADVFKKKYSIKKIEIKDGYIHTKIFSDGNDNFHFLKQIDSAGVQTQNVNFDIESMVFENINSVHIDYRNNIKSNILIQRNKLSGNLKENVFDLVVSTNLIVNHFTLEGVEYLPGKRINTEANMLVDNRKIVFKENSITVDEKLRFIIVGNIDMKEGYNEMAINLKGNDLNLVRLIELLPENISNLVKDFSSNGDLSIDADIKGKLSENELPVVKAKISLKNGSLKHNKLDARIEKINFEGTANYRKSGKKIISDANIPSFSCYIKDNPIAGSLLVDNINDPSIDLFVKGLFDLETMSAFVPDTIIQSVKGRADVLMYLKTKVSDLKNIHRAAETVEASGKIILTNVSAESKRYQLFAKEITGEMIVESKQLTFTNLTGSLNNASFAARGTIGNIIPYLLDSNGVAKINSEITIDQLNLNDPLYKTGGVFRLAIPKTIEGVASVTCKKFMIDNCVATNISGEIDFREQKIFFHPLTMDIAGGSITSRGFIDARDTSAIVLVCESSAKNIDINSAFKQFDNFGQTALVSDNIKGIATADVSLQSVWHSNLMPYWDKILATCNLTIEKGELIKYEPLRELSRFIKLSELEHIKFSKLQNQIEIKNEKVYIPKMDVRSNAIDIICSGVHGFDNSIDYQIKLYLNDLLAKKAKKAKKENEEFGKVEDDGLGKISLFVLMTGTLDKPIIRYDRRGAFTSVKQEVKTEKETIRKILKDEFGRSKKDSVKTKEKEEEQDKFKVIWDDDKKSKKSQKEDSEEDF